MSASLIGRSGSSAFRLSTTTVSMSLTGSCFSSDSAPRPLYGAFFVKEFARAAHLFPSSVSWFDLKVRFFIPTRASPRSMRAEAVKIGRRTNLAACFALARPYLDGFEHDGTLNAVAMTIRGEHAFGARFNRATTLYPVGP